MSTRGILLVRKDGTLKVAQFNRSDSYPSYLGLYVLDFLDYVNIEKFKNKLNNCTLVSADKAEEDFKKYKDEYENDKMAQYFYKNEYPANEIEDAHEVLPIIMSSREKIKLIDDSEFFKDHIFCEWAYEIDMDKMQFNVYEMGDLKKSYPLNALPNEKDFVAELDN